ncbi:MAG TPA: ATP-binding cassette domain-containing protein [Candidatus Acidoferrales bacterium]|nr:ATP-binding cassette domain-containing protein [Candidatus Acidoferrales bacterium]
MPETTDKLNAAPVEPASSDGGSNAVETRSLTRRYGDLIAVDHLNFICPSGAIFGLLGPNGAGKSTLIKMLTTLLPPSEGTALVAGHDIVRDPRAVRRSIGYVSQMLSADGDLSAYENLSISAKLYGVPRAERAARIEHALEFMDLSHVAGKLVKHFSGGMIRKLEIAQSMLHRPHILFLDEPTVGLDPIAKQSVWQNIRDLCEEFGTTILMTTHDMQEADELCETVAFMHSGQLAAMGSPATLKLALGADASLGDVFIHYTGATISEGGDFRDAARLRSTTRRLG